MLTGSARAPGSAAVAAARTLLAEIDARDSELASLRRNAEPIEVMRVEERLAVLGDEVGRGEGGQDHEEMRLLLRGQLDVFRRLIARHEHAAAERARLLDTLRSLWTAVRQLRMDDERPVARPSGIESLLALCLSIESDAHEPSPTLAQGSVVVAAPSAPSATMS
jgi:hypothetical protein